MKPTESEIKTLWGVAIIKIEIFLVVTFILVFCFFSNTYIRENKNTLTKWKKSLKN